VFERVEQGVFLGFLFHAAAKIVVHWVWLSRDWSKAVWIGRRWNNPPETNATV